MCVIDGKAQRAERRNVDAQTPHGLLDSPQSPDRLSHLSRIAYNIPLSFHPFLFCSQKRNGWSPKKKTPPISLCLIPVRRSGWPETRFAQTVGPEFPLLRTSIAPAGPARLRMGGEAVPCSNVCVQARSSRRVFFAMSVISTRRVKGGWENHKTKVRERVERSFVKIGKFNPSRKYALIHGLTPRSTQALPSQALGQLSPKRGRASREGTFWFSICTPTHFPMPAFLRNVRHIDRTYTGYIACHMIKKYGKEWKPCSLERSGGCPCGPF